ncbi:hypothetical protein H6503_03050 [Candidatus Woesearchaeota archaeon]|nr:hypothetical protein [Candidatus Woesearchaeota archaeon]
MTAIKSHDKIIREEANISMWLDSYNDIFSDFDPRQYANRTLSDDFLKAAKKEALEMKTGDYQMRFLIPNKLRNIKSETVIKKRLRQHFSAKHESHLRRKNSTVKQGAAFIFAGTMLMFVSAALAYLNKNFWITFFGVVMEPAGWFSFWEGLNLVIFKSKVEVPDIEFYSKMSRCTIVFNSY